MNRKLSYIIFEEKVRRNFNSSEKIKADYAIIFLRLLKKIENENVFLKSVCDVIREIEQGKKNLKKSALESFPNYFDGLKKVTMKFRVECLKRHR